MLKRIRMYATTRVECTFVIDVPGEVTEKKLDRIAKEIYYRTDRDAYVREVDFWLAGEHKWEDVECNCYVKHANTDLERRTMLERLTYLEGIKDEPGTLMVKAQLDNTECPARPVMSEVL